MKKLATLLLAMILPINMAMAADTATNNKEALIDELIVELGFSGKDFSSKFKTVFETQISQNFKELSSEHKQIIKEVVADVVDENFIKSKKLNQMMYVIYNKNFTEDELRQLVAFYKSDLGKKFVKALPQITQESALVGRQMGMSIAPTIENRLKARFDEEGLDFP